MKKSKKVGIDRTRRRFMAYFSSVGLGATLVPGILWGKMQETGSQQITLDMLTTALKLGGVEFNAEERQAMVNTANQNLTIATHQTGFIGRADQDVSGAIAPVQRSTVEHRHISRRACHDAGEGRRCGDRARKDAQPGSRNSMGLQGHHRIRRMSPIPVRPMEDCRWS